MSNIMGKYMWFCVRLFTNNHTAGSNGTATVGSNGTPIYVTLLAFLEGRKIGSTKILTKTPDKVSESSARSISQEKIVSKKQKRRSIISESSNSSVDCILSTLISSDQNLEATDYYKICPISPHSPLNDGFSRTWHGTSLHICVLALI